MRILILLLALSAPCFAKEANAPNGIAWESYHANDHFSWSNYDDTLHIALGFSLAYVGANALEKRAHMPAWEAALIATLGSIVLESTREAFFSTYTSKTDIKTWSAGATLGGLTYTVINF